MSRGPGFERKTTVGVEKETNGRLGRKKREYGDIRRNDTIDRLIEKDDVLWSFFREVEDLKAAKSLSFAEIDDVLDEVGWPRAAEIGFEKALQEFRNAES